MNFYKYVLVCIFLLPLNLIACSSVNVSDGCSKNQLILNPFFNTTKNSDCDLPLAPVLNEFDKGVLNVCGDWINRPKAELFRSMLDNATYKKYVDKIYESLDHQVFTPNATLKEFKDELTQLWFNRRAFTHVMCGEPGRYTLGGMHFFGRYLQAQENHWAGRSYDSAVVDITTDKVYVIGVIFRNANNHLAIDHRNAYDLTHADEIILNATKAYKAFSKNVALGQSNQKCLYNIDGITYSVVMRDKAVVTFYPTLTPKCDSGKECNCIELGQ